MGVSVAAGLKGARTELNSSFLFEAVVRETSMRALLGVAEIV